MDRAHDQIAAYALDALTPEERDGFEAHLRGCEACRLELASLQDAAGALAELVTPIQPPPDLRDRLLAQARAEQAEVVPLRRRSALPLAAGGVAALAAAAAIVLGLWAGSLSGSLDEERDARRAQDLALAVVADPRARHLAVSSGAGTLVVASNGRAALVLRGLERAPAERVYEAWILRTGAPPQPAGLFSGGTDRAVALGAAVPRGASVGVTIEPDGGSARPSGRPILVVKT